MSDILTEWHPVFVGKMIVKAIGDRDLREVAEQLGTTRVYLAGVLKGQHSVSAQMAARLNLIGLDGRELYLKQAERSFEIARRYETGELQRPALLKRGRA